MAFSDQLSSDMSKLLSTDYFGSSGTYIDPNGQETELTVVLFGESNHTKDVDGIKTKVREQLCAWDTSDLSTVNLRSHVVVGTTKWPIVSVEYQDDYQTTVKLEIHELYEHTRPEFRRR